MSGMTVLSQLILWNSVRKKISFVKISLKDIIKHIKPNLVLFIPVIAVSLYKMIDKVMLGMMTNVNEVGFFENAEKITNIPMTLITALGTVMLPRMSNILAKGEKGKANDYITKSISFVMFLSFAMCFGLIAIGYKFAPFYFGQEFQKTGILIMLLAVTLPFLSFANVIRTQYLIPKERDKDYIISVSLGAIVNLVINIILIPKYASVGACVGTIFAEAIVAIYQTISVKNELNVKKYIKNALPFFIKAFVMLIAVYSFNYISMNTLLRLLLQLSLGCVIYGVLNLKYILSIVDIKKILSKMGRKKIKSACL